MRLKNAAKDEPIKIVKQNISDQEISELYPNEYMRYVTSVLKDRALPDARDGLKPSQRRVLVAMDDLNLHSNSSFKKCAKICGDCSGNYHPHGEAIVYPTLTRMAQDWILRYPLIDPQGNFGSPDPDCSAAAMRYTEARLSKYGDAMMTDLSQDVVNYVPNYNEEKLEPTVLPSLLPNLLVNGSAGIAVGVATKLPPHNLRELALVIKAYVDNPNISTSDIMKIMPGPDFPTGGVLLGQKGVKDYYETGKGSIQIEGVYSIEIGDKGVQQIVITELPYGASTELFGKQLKQLVEDRKIEGIINYKDLSSQKDKIRAVVYVAKNANANLVLNQLLKHTCLRVSFNANQTVLINKSVVENATLKMLIQVFIDHRKDVLVRRWNAELVKSQNRVHILDGLINVTKYIDEVIKIIRKSESPEEAAQAFIDNNYVTSMEQAKAVLNITLKTLTKLEANGLINERNALNDRIVWLKDTLSNTNKILKWIVQEQEKLAKTIGDDRRTKIGSDAGDIEQEDLIEEEQIIVSLTKDGYIKRMPLDTYRIQARGGKGVKGGNKREDDEMSDIFTASSHDIILFFTNKGIIYRKKGYEIPNGARVGKGTHLANVLALGANEFVTNTIPVKTLDQDGCLLIITKNGLIKRSELRDYDSQWKTKGLTAIKLNEGDELAYTEFTDGKKDVFIVTRLGKAIRYSEESVKITARATKGIRALNLQEDDSIAQMLTISPSENPDIMIVTEMGFGKRVESASYKCRTGRFSKGVNTINKVKADRNGVIVGACTVQDDDSIIMLTSQGKVIQIPVEDVRSVKRTAMGVRILKLDIGDTVKAVTKIVKGAIQEDEEEVSE
jgi:DNA gyrase subunit A